MIRNKGPTLKSVRERKGMTAKDLAAILDVSASYLSEIETGKRPLTQAFALRIAAAINTPPQDLLDELLSVNVYAPAEESGTMLREDPTPYTIRPPSPAAGSAPPSDDYKALAVWFTDQLATPEAWELVRKFTVAAQAGNADAARCARALINLLTGT